MTNEKQNIFSSARPMIAKKTWQGVVHDEGNLPMMSHDPLTMWSHGVMWQIKSLMSPIPQGL